MKGCLPILALPLILGMAVVQDLRDQRRERAQRYEMIVRVRKETLLAEARKEYLDEALRQFPQLANPDGPLRRACLKRYAKLVESSSPLLDLPDYPLTIATQEACRLHLTPTVITKLTP